MRRHAPFLIAAAIFPLLAGPVLAQGLPRGPELNTKKEPLPPALPGLAGRAAAPVIPADPDTGNLSPNDALFDAITRGDLQAARAAVARGASIDARNVLGQRPVDAAVDRGRNDIAFFLLASRGPSSAAPPPPMDLSAPPTMATPRGRPAPAPRQAAAQAAPPVKAMPMAPRLWANDGGTPRPDVGFLGFDAGRTSGGPNPG